MIQRSSTTPLTVHACVKLIADTNLPARNATHMRISRPSLLRINHRKEHAGARQLTDIANLPTRLCIERRSVENDLALVA